MKLSRIALLLLLAIPALGQSAPAVPNIVGIPLGIDQTQARKIASQLFPSPNYKAYASDSATGNLPMGFAYDRVDGGHDQFGIGFSATGEVDYLVHIVEYNKPGEQQHKAKSAGGPMHLSIFKHKQDQKPAQDPATIGTNLNVHPTADSFVASLIDKYGEPSARRDDLHIYAWFLDTNGQPLSTFNLPVQCQSFPELNIFYTSGPSMIPGSGPRFGHSFPAPPQTASNDCGIGIYARLYTTGIDHLEHGPLIVSGYELQVYNQSAAGNDMAQRQERLMRKQHIGLKPQL
jgi:hypothetical protein